MRQRITTSQLQQLTPSQQEKLRALWKPEIGDYFTIPSMKYMEGLLVATSIVSKEYIPLLSVGQCIELLNCMVNINNAFAEYPKAWCVMNMNRKKEYWAEELIDALWEVVKSIL